MSLPFDSVQTGFPFFLIEGENKTGNLFQVSIQRRTPKAVMAQVVEVLQGPPGCKSHLILVSRTAVEQGGMRFFRSQTKAQAEFAK